jgi:hypothetical protein
MTEEELYQLRCFYAYRQKAYVRSLLAERLKAARVLLGAALSIYYQQPTARHGRYLKMCRLKVTRYQERIEELDSIGVSIYVRRNQHQQ